MRTCPERAKHYEHITPKLYICDEMDLLKVSKSGDSPSHVPVSGLVLNPFGHLHLLSAHIVGSGQL